MTQYRVLASEGRQRYIYTQKTTKKYIGKKNYYIYKYIYIYINGQRFLKLKIDKLTDIIPVL
jgi:hypothetical protein